jgi:hypothetical protein
MCVYILGLSTRGGNQCTQLLNDRRNNRVMIPKRAQHLPQCNSQMLHAAASGYLFYTMQEINRCVNDKYVHASIFSYLTASFNKITMLC